MMLIALLGAFTTFPNTSVFFAVTVTYLNCFEFHEQGSHFPILSACIYADVQETMRVDYRKNIENMKTGNFMQAHHIFTVYRLF